MKQCSFLQKYISDLLLILAACVTFAGCGAHLAHQKTLGNIINATVAQADSSVQEGASADSAGAEAQMYAQVDSLIDSARSACNMESYAMADSMLREALATLETGNELYRTEDEQEYADRQALIISLYTDVFPSDYIDRLPDEIASMVFQHQLTFSLDSMQLSPEDSTRLANLNCQQGIPYNVPIVWNGRVQKALFVFVKRHPGDMAHWLARANCYLPVMRRLFADNALPTDLSYLPLIESGFNPSAYSFAHAAGIWQFITSTGFRYGLRGNFWFDERRDPLKSTKAAICYLKDLYDLFGDWYLALAAYNCGENAVARAIERAGTSDYWQLKLPTETMNYVPKFIAALMIAKNPVCFGFTPDSADTFMLDTVHTNECLDLHTIAGGIGVGFNDLKAINPHISRWCTPPDAVDVTLYLPRGKASEYAPFYATLTDKDKVKWRLHRIKRGENLAGVARKFGVAPDILRQANKLKSTRLAPGNYLYIPLSPAAALAQTGDSGPENDEALLTAEKKASVAPITADHSLKKNKYRIKPGENLWQLASRYGIALKDICRWNNIKHPGMVQAGDIVVIYGGENDAEQLPANGPLEESDGRSTDSRQAKTYTVKSGDNLYTLAKNFGLTVDDLAAMNNRASGDFIIHPGQKLVYSSCSSPVDATGHKAAHAQQTGRYIPYTVVKGDNLYSIAKRFSTNIQLLNKANGLAPKSVLAAGDTIKVPVGVIASGPEPQHAKVVYYTVRKGDNLWSIARSYCVPVKKLCAVNGITRDTVLMPGDSIMIVTASNK